VLKVVPRHSGCVEGCPVGLTPVFAAAAALAAPSLCAADCQSNRAAHVDLCAAESDAGILGGTSSCSAARSWTGVAAAHAAGKAREQSAGALTNIEAAERHST
jgi:hypothetical protein